MKITLYTNVFPSDGKKLMSVSLMVWRSEYECSAIEVPSYVEAEEDIFRKAMDVVSVANSLEHMFHQMGHDVELDPILTSALKVNDRLVKGYKE